MTKNLISLILSTLILAACGGGGAVSNFTVTHTWDGTTYSCPTQTAYDQCGADSCAACTCTVGCDASAPNAKLKITMTPSTLLVNQQGSLTLQLSNAASVKQTVKFNLVTPAGGVGYSTTVPFSGGCNTLSHSIGSKSITATVVVPANTVLPCEFVLRKSFTTAANPVVFSLEGLEKLELNGTLPVVTVTPY